MTSNKCKNKALSRVRPAMFPVAELTAGAKTQSHSPDLRWLKPCPAQQRAALPLIPHWLYKAVLLSMNNELIWVKNIHLFPLCYFFFLTQIILTNPDNVSLQVIHLAEGLLPKRKARMGNPGLNAAFADSLLSKQTIPVCKTPQPCLKEELCGTWSDDNLLAVTCCCFFIEVDVPRNHYLHPILHWSKR